ncbi:psbP domain-containing protein 1, chloroplastic isoform X2 [Rhodamnia argentea]|uniref:PsbP domain-containing protein 1, chloroplastic isoform X2 n=1 Tax=Rhodamnia argentea TaxID=178133 RepID=A0A8B8P6T1_9MYRT|nr:psbP domain-containing protein 1, chloroplastic isoform X2 [Rhodamnia argentea]
MAKMTAVQHQHRPPSSLSLLPSSFSDFNGTRLCIQYKRKVWQPKGALRVTASSIKEILIMGGNRFITVFLSRLLVKVGHQVTLFTGVEAPIIQQLPAFAVPRRSVMALILSSCILSRVGWGDIAFAQQSVGFREYIDTFDGYSFNYPQNWVQVRGAGADIFFRDPYVLDENLSVEFSSPSSSSYKSVEDLGPPEEAGKKVLKQYLTEFMSTRLGVRRESNIISTSSRIADDGKMYYQVEVNMKSYANNNELAVMPQDRVVRLEWDRRYLSVLGVENNRLYELRLQTPENVFLEEENDLRQVMDSFRVNTVAT